jgi:hypothetical protein
VGRDAHRYARALPGSSALGLDLAGLLLIDLAVVVQGKRFDGAAAYTAEGVKFDPLVNPSWVLRFRHLRRDGRGSRCG